MDKQVQQIMLSTLMDVNGNIKASTLGDNFDFVKERVLTICKEKGKDSFFTLLALALAKYDVHGAPSNWNPEFKHEKTILRWTKWVFENESEYKEELYDIIKDYTNGLIPCATDLMFDYFT